MRQFLTQADLGHHSTDKDDDHTRQSQSDDTKRAAGTSEKESAFSLDMLVRKK